MGDLATPLTVILDALASMGALGVAGLLIWGLYTEKVVPHGRLDDLRREMEQMDARITKIITDRDRLREELDRYRKRT